MTKENAALKSLNRQKYREALNFKANTGFIENKGVSAYISLWHYFVNPTSEGAVECIINELRHKLEQLEHKEIPRDRWPRFFQDQHWIEKTYQRYGLPYPGKVTEIKPIQNEPIPGEIQQ